MIIGGGAHGLATAYYLSKNHGIKNIAVLEKSYIGAGGSGRNTTIIRSNYRTPEGAEFYRESVKLYENLSQELNFNTMFSQHGHLTLAHSDRGMIVSTERAEVNQLLDIDSRVVDRDEVKELCPQIHLDGTWPIYGALYHPPGGIVRHDAVVWGYAQGGRPGGAEIHQGIEVTGIDVENGSVAGVDTNRGDIVCDTVIACTAGWSTQVADMAGVRLPIWTSILQACVTEPVKPFLDVVIVSGQLHIYISQTDRGEFLMGSGDRAVPDVLVQGDVPVRRGARQAHVDLFPQLAGTQDPPSVDRPLRHDARLQPDPGRHRGRGLHHRLRLGHVRLQGVADRRHDARRARRHEEDACAHRAVQARALLHRHARLRGRSGLGEHTDARPGHQGERMATTRSLRTSRSPRRTSSSRSQTSPNATASRPTSTTSTAATRPRSTCRSIDRLADRPDAKLVCVTAITPTRPARARRRPRSR